jgi:hypothetical protein
MIDFSLRHLNFPLNELHKRTICIVFIQRESSSSKKNLYPDAQKKKFPQKNLYPFAQHESGTGKAIFLSVAI